MDYAIANGVNFIDLYASNLAPDVVEMILNGTEPKTLTMGKLRKGFPDE